MSRAILLDAAPPRRYGNTDAVITVSAVAEYACRREGVPHRVLSAVASEDALASLQDDYWNAQVEWLTLLERRMFESSPSLAASGMRPVAACGYLLKLLLDNLYIRAYESAALTDGEWSEIVHCVRPEGPPLLGEVLPVFCASRGVAYTRITEAAEPAVQRSAPLSRAREKAAPAVRGMLQAAGGCPRRASPQDGAMRLFLLTVGYDSADLLRRNAGVGGRSLLAARGRVLELRRGLPRLVGNVPQASDAQRREWRDIAGALRRDEELWDWPASWFEGQAAPLAVQRVTRWVQDTMPDVMASARWFQDLYATEAVEAVVAPFLMRPSEIGAFVAARAREGTSAVLIEHGDIAHAAPSWDLNLLAADTVIVPTQELAEHLNARRARYTCRTAELVVGSYRWPRYARLAGGRRRHGRRHAPAVDLGRFDERKPTLVYLVTALVADSRYLNNAWYPDPWYFGLQAAIVDALAPHERFNVVVKLFPATECDASPLSDYVADKRAPNLMVSRAPFSDWIPRAERVVADMASTGLYEVLVAGRPAMGLLWRNHRARPGAITALGDALKPFSTHEEAAAEVDRFAAEPRPGVPRLVLEGRDILETLTGLSTSAWRRT